MISLTETKCRQYQINLDTKVQLMEADIIYITLACEYLHHSDSSRALIELLCHSVVAVALGEFLVQPEDSVKVFDLVR